ncbi:amidohydrolase family protein [Agarivorans sp. JK6]|uniref:amidohydrolase family protein n=1 Tax=Agarivorans sp. JK6 TaxID=2997426 RepID=UPI0038739413
MQYSLKIGALIIASCILTVTNVAADADSTTKTTLISNVRIFDGVNKKLTPGHVLVANNLIKTISAEPIPVPEGATLIDGGNRVLTPGFIDVHTHMSLIAPFDKLENEYTAVYVGAAAGQMAEEMLYRGFTSVRDAGGSSIGVQRAIDDGWFPGPRVFSSGPFITQTSGHLDMRDRTNTHHNMGGSRSYAEQIGHYVAVDGTDEMLAATRQAIRDGDSPECSTEANSHAH